MQFYSMINFHCVLNEMSGAIADPVSSVGSQQQAQAQVEDQ